MTPPADASGYQLWEYYPSVAGGVIVAIIFAVLSVAHLFFLFRTGKRFCIPLVIGGIFEVVGYGARVVAHYKITATLPYAIQSLLILLAPILFAASVYMYLGRIIGSVGGERHSLVPLRWLTKVFVLGDITCFLVQGAGGGVLSGAKSQSRVNLGEDVILAGLILQIVIFFVFVIVAAIFHMRMRSDSSAVSLCHVPWQRLLLGLYAVSALIAIRNIFRAIEYGMGNTGYLLDHEWPSFVFDAALMIIVLLICLLWYRTDLDSHYVPRDIEVGRLAKDSSSSSRV